MNDMIELLLESHNQFDLDQFYQNNDQIGCDGALIIITPKQQINVLAPIEHCFVSTGIYQLLYNDFHQFDGDPLEENDSEIWQEQALQYGNIIIQVIYGSYSLVWIPPVINDYQYYQLKELASFVEKHNLTNRDMEYCTNINDQKLEIVIDSLKDRVRVDFVSPYNENLLIPKNKVR